MKNQNQNKKYLEYLKSPDWRMTTLDVKNFHKIETKKSVLEILFWKK